MRRCQMTPDLQYLQKKREFSLCGPQGEGMEDWVLRMNCESERQILNYKANRHSYLQ